MSLGLTFEFLAWYVQRMAKRFFKSTVGSELVKSIKEGTAPQTSKEFAAEAYAQPKQFATDTERFKASAGKSFGMASRPPVVGGVPGQTIKTPITSAEFIDQFKQCRTLVGTVYHPMPFENAFVPSTGGRVDVKVNVMIAPPMLAVPRTQIIAGEAVPVIDRDIDGNAVSRIDHTMHEVSDTHTHARGNRMRESNVCLRDFLLLASDFCSCSTPASSRCSSCRRPTARNGKSMTSRSYRRTSCRRSRAAPARKPTSTT